MKTNYYYYSAELIDKTNPKNIIDIIFINSTIDFDLCGYTKRKYYLLTDSQVIKYMKSCGATDIGKIKKLSNWSSETIELKEKANFTITLHIGALETVWAMRAMQKDIKNNIGK